MTRAQLLFGVVGATLLALGGRAVSQVELPAGPNRDVVYRKCASCHDLQNLVDTNAPDRSDKYNGFEYSFTARIARINIFGGGMVERMLSNSCDDDWNPNLLLYCDQSQNQLPFRSQFKVAGSVPVKYGIPFKSTRRSAAPVLEMASATGAVPPADPLVRQTP
jgi:hypothetical protein